MLWEIMGRFGVGGMEGGVIRMLQCEVRGWGELTSITRRNWDMIRIERAYLSSAKEYLTSRIYKLQ